jgi:hypothetical protein
MPHKNATKRKRLERVSVEAERREKPDWDRFAWALLQYARIVANGDANKEQNKS